MAVLVKDGSVHVAGSSCRICSYDQLDQMRAAALRTRLLDVQKLLDLAKVKYDPAPAQMQQKIKWLLKQQDVLTSLAKGSPGSMDAAPTLSGMAAYTPAPSPYEQVPAPIRERPTRERGRSPYAEHMMDGPPAVRPKAFGSPNLPTRGTLPPGRARSPMASPELRSRTTMPERPQREQPDERPSGVPTPIWPAQRPGSPMPGHPGSPMPGQPQRHRGTLPEKHANRFIPMQQQPANFWDAQPVRDFQGPTLRMFTSNGRSPSPSQALNYSQLTEFQLEQLKPNRLHQKCVEIRELLDSIGFNHPNCPGSRAMKIKWALRMQELLKREIGLPQAPRAGVMTNEAVSLDEATAGPMAAGTTQLFFKPPPRQRLDVPRPIANGSQQWFNIPDMPTSGGFEEKPLSSPVPSPKPSPKGGLYTSRRRGAPTLATYEMPGVQRKDLLLKKNGNPHVHHEYVKDLGAGAFGVTALVKHKTTKQHRCLKTVNKAKAQMPPEILEAEFQALALIDHPHIIKLFEYWEDHANCYFITEAYKGGTLLDVIEEHRKKRSRISEEWLAQVFQQVLQGIGYCHQRNLIHKDLKSENIMLLERETDENPYGVHAVVIDLGLSECFTVTDLAHEVAGTPITMAPELWRAAMGQGTFGPKCDIYSIGCVLFRMLSSAGIPPIVPTGTGDPQDWLMAIRRGPNWNQIKGGSPEVKDLVKKMLEYDEDKRPDAQECLEHPWFEKITHITEELGLRTVHCQALLSHRTNQRTPFQKNVLMKVASQLGAAELRDVNTVFRRYDRDNSGALSVAEVCEMLQDLGVEEDAALEAAQSMDVSHDGMVDYTEFVAACISHRKASLRDLLQEAFNQYDLNGDGTLSEDEVRAVLTGDTMPQDFAGDVASDSGVEAILDELQFDRYGSITFDEFAAIFIPP